MKAGDWTYFSPQPSLFNMTKWLPSFAGTGRSCLPVHSTHKMSGTPLKNYPAQPARPTVSNSAAQLDPNEQKLKPWKYEGYMEFSKWMASEDDFFIVRRFQTLNAHVILYQQDRIRRIEEHLREFHDEIAADSSDKRKNSSFGWDSTKMLERKNLLEELTGRLHHYSEYREGYGLFKLT